MTNFISRMDLRATFPWKYFVDLTTSGKKICLRQVVTKTIPDLFGSLYTCVMQFFILRSRTYFTSSAFHFCTDASHIGFIIKGKWRKAGSSVIENT